MPTLWAHRNYFNNSSTFVTPALADSKGGYPRWQASVIAVGTFPGQLQLLWDKVKAWWRPVRVIEVPVACEPQVITQVVHVLQKPKPKPRIGALVRWARRAQKAPAPPVGVLAHVQALRDHPAYPVALDAVAQTATTLGFNRPEAWQGLSRQMKSSPGRAENTFRHMRACEIVRAQSPSTLTNPDCNLLVELAYYEWAKKG